MGVLCGRVCVPERNPDDVRLACKQDSVCVCVFARVLFICDSVFGLGCVCVCYVFFVSV